MHSDENLTPFIPQDVLKKETLSPDDWKRIAGLLNLPLNPEAGPMATQIGAFFRENIVATEQEAIKINGQEFMLPTAGLKTPRESVMGVPTVGWYLFQATQTDGSASIDIIAEIQDRLTQGPTQISGRELALERPAGSEDFTLVTFGDNPRTKYLKTIPGAMLRERVGHKIRFSQKSGEGKKELSIFHVFNTLPKNTLGE